MQPNANQLAEQLWDSIVVGTGIGGATIGYALARAGQRVLFCEKGMHTRPLNEGSRGGYPKRTDSAFFRAGRWTEKITDRSGSQPFQFRPFMGVGTGGSSALYGMVFEKPRASDFLPSWPINEAELAPFFERAKGLFRINPTQLSPAGAELFGFFEGKGLSPRRLELACENLPGCDHCQGYLCPKECKNDASRACLEPALREHEASLLTECEVLRLEAGPGRVEKLVARHHGRELQFRARNFILAAGALNTPRILLSSASSSWPGGLANRSGLVGRNLMRHFVDLYLVFTRTRSSPEGPSKELGMDSLHHWNGRPMGVLQSFGRMPPADQILADLKEDVASRHGKVAALLMGSLTWILAPIFRMLFSRGVVLGSILEDTADPENQVRLEPDGKSLSIEYRISASEKECIATIRDRIQKALKPYRFLLLKEAERNHHLAHACGTCRFGDDPETSVLDRNNRAHGVSNLFVVDSSFFPSSTSVNPSWMIAANALRVAEVISNEL